MPKYIDKVTKADGGKVVDLISVDENKSYDATAFTGLGNSVLGNKTTSAYKYSASLNITTAPTSDGDINVTLLGNTYSFPVLAAKQAVFNLVISIVEAGSPESGNIYITLGSHNYTIDIETTDTIATILAKIAAVGFDGYTVETSTVNSQGIVTFTAQDLGSKPSLVFGSGATKVSGFVNRYTQTVSGTTFENVEGYDGLTTTELATWIAEQGIQGWDVNSDGSIVTFSRITSSNSSSATLDPNATGLIGTITASSAETSVLLLTQTNFATSNTRYVIRYDYDLAGATIVMPENCTLEFDGGSLRNGTITGNGTLYQADTRSHNILTNVKINGTNYGTLVAEWFGAVNSTTECSYKSIQLALDNAKYISSHAVLLFNKNYFTGDHEIRKINYVKLLLSTNTTIYTALSTNTRSAIVDYTLNDSAYDYDPYYGNSVDYQNTTGILVDNGHSITFYDSSNYAIKTNLSSNSESASYKGTGISFDVADGNHTASEENMYLYQVYFKNVKFEYYHIGIDLDLNNFYINTFGGIFVNWCFYAIYHHLGFSNSGERITFKDCTFAQNFVVLYDCSQGFTAGPYFENCSLDFNQVIAYFSPTSIGYLPAAATFNMNVTFDRCWNEGTNTARTHNSDVWGLAHGYFIKASAGAVIARTDIPKFIIKGGRMLRYSGQAALNPYYLIHSTNAMFEFDSVQLAIYTPAPSDSQYLFLVYPGEKIEYTYKNLYNQVYFDSGQKFISEQDNCLKLDLTPFAGTYSQDSSGNMNIGPLNIVASAGVFRATVSADGILTITPIASGSNSLYMYILAKFPITSNRYSYTVLPEVSIAGDDGSVTDVGMTMYTDMMSANGSLIANHGNSFGFHTTTGTFQSLYDQYNKGYVIPGSKTDARQVAYSSGKISNFSIYFSLGWSGYDTTKSFTFNIKNIYVFNSDEQVIATPNTVIVESYKTGDTFPFNSRRIKIGDRFLENSRKRELVYNADGKFHYQDGTTSLDSRQVNEVHVPAGNVARYVKLATIPQSSSGSEISYNVLLNYSYLDGTYGFRNSLYYLSANNRSDYSASVQLRMVSTSKEWTVTLNDIQLFYYVDDSNNLIIYCYLKAYCRIGITYLNQMAYQSLATVDYSASAYSTSPISVYPRLNDLSYSQTPKYGTTVNRPTVAANFIPTGFIYYNTTTGTDQVHTGSDVWIDLANPAEGTWSITTGTVLTAATATYSKIGKQIAISGTLTFATAATDVSITLPYAPDYGGIFTFGNLTFTLTSGSTTATVQSSVITTAQTFQLNYKTA